MTAADTVAWLAGGAAAAFLVGTGSYVLIAPLFNRMLVHPRIALATGGTRRGDGSQRMAEGADRFKSNLASVATAAGRLMPLSAKDREKIVVNLQNAGYRSANALTIMLGIKFACLMAGLGLGMVLVTPMVPGALGMFVGIGAGVFGGVLLNVVPELLLRRLAGRRLHQLNAGFAETLDLLVVCLESGLTFETGLRRTVENVRSFQSVLARELRQAVLDMSVHGRTREEALTYLAERVDSQNYRDLAITVGQAERHGTPLGEALRNLARSARVDAVARMQEKMARLPTFLIFPSVAFILPGIMVIVGGPAILQLTTSLENVGG